ncbi:hypothetical protein ACH47X_03715 [Promicromonospora kroppenstedtii]|uniref:Uncharacterized protein n=1 Tax=Promicromonospora kroppenstedtii TaxID=440482 RepID=A0ABW7XFH3_9MICO
MTLELVLRVTAKFAVIAGVFMVSAAMFSTVVQSVGQPVARLVARYGVRGALAILVRTRRYQSAACRRTATWRVYARAAWEAFGASLAVVPVVVLLAVPMMQSFRQAETVVQGVAYALLLLSLVYFVGPIGLKRALVRLGDESAKPGWPPAIAHIGGSTTPGSHWKESIRSYHRYLHGSFVRIAMYGTLLGLLGVPAVHTGGVMEEAVPTGYFVLLLLVLFQGANVLQGFPWWFDRRLRTIALIATFLEGLAPKRQWYLDLIEDEPFSKVREPKKEEPTRSARVRLVRVVASVEWYARSLHRSQKLSLRHPLGHLLDLETAQLRVYLAEPRSLDEEVPNEVREALRRISSILIGGTSAFLQEIAPNLSHLEEQVLAESERPTWTSRFSGALDLTGRALTVAQVSVGAGLALAIPAYLLLSGQATLGEIVDAVTSIFGFSTSS